MKSTTFVALAFAAGITFLLGICTIVLVVGGSFLDPMPAITLANVSGETAKPTLVGVWPDGIGSNELRDVFCIVNRSIDSKELWMKAATDKDAAWKWGKGCFGRIGQFGDGVKSNGSWRSVCTSESVPQWWNPRTTLQFESVSMKEQYIHASVAYDETSGMLWYHEYYGD